MTEEETKESQEYIDFSHGKLGIVHKIRWKPEIGEPVHGEKFIFSDEYGEDWGIILGQSPEPEIREPVDIESEDEDVPEDSEFDGEDDISMDSEVINGIAERYFTEEDEGKFAEILKDEEEFLQVCEERVEHHGLKMKMLATDIRFDRKKITFHFAAEGRVDFRMLVRDLASIFRCRIELHQIGARDEAKLYVGCGPCGRLLCCRTWLKHFQTIGIKMARAQNLPLNPGKISGNCGRLLCCLSYECDTYVELSKDLPKVGDQKEIDGTLYEVNYISPLSQTINLQSVAEDERHRKLKISNEEYKTGMLKKKKEKQ